MRWSPPDPFDDALEDLRITGSVLLNEVYGSPWCVEVPAEARLRAALQVAPQARVLLFHFVRAGEFVLRLAGHAPVTVRAGEVAICPSGAPHRMSQGRGARAWPLEEVLAGRVTPAVAPAGAARTELVCGAFLAHATPLNPLLGALPPVVKVSTTGDAGSPMLAGVAWMLAHELERGALRGFSAARVIELFFAEAIRAYRTAGGPQGAGWFRALGDPRIAEALRRIHAAPAQRWTVAALAADVALSPSRFAARFRTQTRRSVMSYLAAWRANLACRLLREGELGLAQIAERVGYQSVPAFSRAFKAQLGEPPAAWRARRRGATADCG